MKPSAAALTDQPEEPTMHTAPTRTRPDPPRTLAGYGVALPDGCYRLYDDRGRPLTRLQARKLAARTGGRPISHWFL